MADEVLNYLRTPPAAPVQAKRNKRNYVPEVPLPEVPLVGWSEPSVGRYACVERASLTE